MSRTITMSPLGLYNWDNTLFDLMEIPEELDKDTLIDNLLVETAELEVLYPNPTVFKNLIGIWSNKQLAVWEKLYSTTQFEYNPIENYDRNETGNDGGTDSHTGTQGRTGSNTASGSDSTDMTRNRTSSGNDKNGHWTAGFDSAASGTDDGLIKNERTERNMSSSDGEINNDTTTYGRHDNSNETITYNDTMTTQTGHTLHAHGNIGVTTTQEMIEQERKIDLFNIYDIIIDDFKMRFCILIY